MAFDKPFKTIQQQIEILSQRGLIIDDHAEHYLSHLNYYRLSGYWRLFLRDANLFKPNATFMEVLNLYIFDREFRLLLLDAIERIEVSVRTQWAYCFSKQYGPHGYLDCSLSSNVHWHAQNLLLLEKERKRSDEPFIAHFSDSNNAPPIWAICEVMSFGVLSRWLKNLKPTVCKNEISRCYGLDYKVLVSFVEHMTYLRNCCAHHSRVWNRRMTKTLKIPRSKPKTLISSLNYQQNSERKIYNTLVMLQYLLNIICPDNHFKKKLTSILDNHNIQVEAMGFPFGWKEKDIWLF